MELEEQTELEYVDVLWERIHSRRPTALMDDSIGSSLPDVSLEFSQNSTQFELELEEDDSIVDVNNENIDNEVSFNMDQVDDADGIEDFEDLGEEHQNEEPNNEEPNNEVTYLKHL